MPAISVTTHRSVVKDLSSTTRVAILLVGGYKGRVSII
jgi:hypothetical protein